MIYHISFDQLSWEDPCPTRTKKSLNSIYTLNTIGFLVGVIMVRNRSPHQIYVPIYGDDWGVEHRDLDGLLDADSIENTIPRLSYLQIQEV